MKITIPDPSLVVLVGASGSGKSTFAARHFRPTEILSSDRCRAMVADDENDQSATGDAFDVLYYVAGKRLAGRRLVVIDATNVKPEDRKRVVALAREYHLFPVALVFDLPPGVCHRRNEARPDRNLSRHVVDQQCRTLRRSLRRLKREGFRQVTVFYSVEEIDAATIERRPLWTDRRDEHGPFDIVGDVHGCFDELVELLQTLGYRVEGLPHAPRASHPEGRKVVFLGDLVDRGPNSPAVLRLVISMVQQGAAYCVPGNHDLKLLRKLRGRDVRITHGLAETLAQMEKETQQFQEQVAQFIEGLISHYLLDHGRLVVAHAGLTEPLQGRASPQVRQFAIWGQTTGETDEFGLPIRYNWAAEYRGRAMVVYGHTPVPEAVWTNRTICIDTGCVFGGKLTALRYPEREIVQVVARKQYYQPVRPFPAIATEGSESHDRPYGDLLDVADVLGKRIINTRIHHNVTIREESALAALEVMVRFAVDPHWLIYLPPTMAPADTCEEGPYLEHPRETFAYFRHHGVASVVCEEKHMGSRAVIVVCRDEQTARKRFAATGETGIVYTRTGRRFFPSADLQKQLIDRLREALDAAGFWDRFRTDWICLDAEIMPWSAKAQELLLSQYAPAGSAGRAALQAAAEYLRCATRRDPAHRPLLQRVETRRECIARYTDAYGRYCWKVDGLDYLKVAPFHLLATEGCVYTDKPHLWHMETLGDLCRADGRLLQATRYLAVDLSNPQSEQQAVEWWEQLTAAGGEGMVVKPAEWIVRGRRGLVQPAVKCRGREYLRIIYGPEYTLPEHLERLRRRSLSLKRSLALREFALGIEALCRFTEGEPLYRVHECVFGVLALESDPVDPRL